MEHNSRWRHHTCHLQEPGRNSGTPPTPHAPPPMSLLRRLSSSPSHHNAKRSLLVLRFPSCPCSLRSSCLFHCLPHHSLSRHALPSSSTSVAASASTPSCILFPLHSLRRRDGFLSHRGKLPSPLRSTLLRNHALLPLNGRVDWLEDGGIGSGNPPPPNDQLSSSLRSLRIHHCSPGCRGGTTCWQDVGRSVTLHRTRLWIIGVPALSPRPALSFPFLQSSFTKGTTTPSFPHRPSCPSPRNCSSSDRWTRFALPHRSGNEKQGCEACVQSPGSSKSHSHGTRTRECHVSLRVRNRSLWDGRFGNMAPNRTARRSG